MIKLVNDTINNKDIDSLINWLGKYPRLTKGPITLELEEKWSKWLGVKNTIFCNSGSSANLLMLWALVEAGRIGRDAKIVVPSVAWATDLAPVIQLGMTPVLCDSNMEDLSVDLNHLETIFKETKPEVLLLVSVLGLVPNMQKINELCYEYNVILLEDTCESMGSKWENKKLGTSLLKSPVLKSGSRDLQISTMYCLSISSTNSGLSVYFGKRFFNNFSSGFKSLVLNLGYSNLPNVLSALNKSDIPEPEMSENNSGCFFINTGRVFLGNNLLTPDIIGNPVFLSFGAASSISFQTS